MKKILLLVLTLQLLASNLALAAQPKPTVTVKEIWSKSTNLPGGNDILNAQTSVAAIQIEDLKNGVVCYGFVSSSDRGRTNDGSYPATSIFCAPISK